MSGARPVLMSKDEDRKREKEEEMRKLTAQQQLQMSPTEMERKESKLSQVSQ